jgi:hypothetical protein
VAKKPPTAGAVGIVDINTDEITFLKNNPGTEERPHGAFIALTDGTISTSTFIHAPGGVLPPAREGGSQHNCDGKGIDSLEVCFGGQSRPDLGRTGGPAQAGPLSSDGAARELEELVL